MIKKNKIKYIFPLILLLLSFSVTAQIRISSPYSRYGLGEMNVTQSTYSAGMGGIGLGLRHPTFINANNPASYTAFDSNSFVFDLGLVSKSTQLKSNISTQDYTNYTTLNHLFFGFPITRWCGVSLGIMPFSKTGYKVNFSDTLTNVGKVLEEFTGSGGVNKVFLGVAFKPFSGFSIGLNLNYFFGTIFKDRSVYLPDDAYSYSIRVKNDISVSGINIDYGMQYQLNLKKNYTLIVGTKFNLPMNVGAKRTLVAERFTKSGEIESIKDTLMYFDSERGKIKMPFGIGGGFTFSKKNIWMLGADLEWQNWKNFRNFGATDSINNSLSVSLGGEYIPSYLSPTGYWKKMSYRLGFRYSQNYLELRNTKINDFSATIGLGFPIRKIKTILNVAFEAGTKGSVSQNLLQENYFRVILGISFRDFWFYRPKLE